MTADGQPACSPAPTITSASSPATERLDDAIGLALVTVLGRRRFLKAAAGGVGALLLAACGQNGSNTSLQPGASAPSVTVSSSKAPWVFVFNIGSQDVTIIDTASNNVVATKPLGASIRWLSNEQRYWDGSNIWTYDFPDNKLQALAIDPKEVKVVKTVDTQTTGPGHSLMLSPDKKTAYLNAGGSNVINVIDVSSAQVTNKIDTGQFP